MCSGTTGGGLKNVPEGTSGTCGPTWSGFLQMAIPGGKGDPGEGVIDLSALNGFVMLTKFQMETVVSVFRSI